MTQVLHRALCCFAAFIAAMVTLPTIGAGAVAATHTSPNWSLPRAGPFASHVSLSLAVDVVIPGEVTTIKTQVRPRAPGRIVFLRRRQNGRFVNVKFARTNRRGIAIFHPSFRAVGAVILRASVLPTGNFRAASSASVVENVDAELPFVLAPNTTLVLGATGPQVRALQQRLSALGYWLGTPNGTFGDATQQAVYALEKATGLGRSGIVGAPFAAALNARVVPHPRTTSGDAIEVDLERDLLLFVKNGVLQYVLNTSTGGGYTYVQDGVTNVATTPRGVYSIGRVVDGLVVDTLGALWRPRFFYEGFAIHGDGYVPPEPVSHGCVRVSNEAINWIWAQNLAPIGSKVWLY